MDRLFSRCLPCSRRVGQLIVAATLSVVLFAVVGCESTTAVSVEEKKTAQPVVSKPSVTPKETKPAVSKPTPKPSTLTFNETRWRDAKVRPEWQIKVDKAVDRYKTTKGRYVVIEKQRKGGVPAKIVFVLHGRESTWNFTKHLHEGSSLLGRTKWVPKGRLPGKNPPYTFEQSAEDALYVLKSLQTVDWKSIDATLTAIERYNGTGYLRFHKNVNSPYLFSGTTLYTRGKYVADGKFSATAVDAQIGCVAILKRMEELKIE
jgi:lysozyme family protein